MAKGCSQRKYIDLVHKISSKWVNWDPPMDIKVGAYGTIDRETGNLQVEGNVYDSDFQEELVRHGLKIKLVDYPVKQGPEEDDFIITSNGAKRKELNADGRAGIPEIAHASLRGEWSVESGKQEVILIMHRPRLSFIPQNGILEHLYKVDKLSDKYLVTSIHTCPAYSMYLSDMTGSKVSLALVAEACPGGAASTGTGFSWWSDVEGGLLRKACDKAGKYLYTPLFAMKRPLSRFSLKRIFRDGEDTELTGDSLWYDALPPWDPLTEEGEEDKIESGIEQNTAVQT